MKAEPVISIITVTYNAAALLERTLKSVFDQDYKAIEYIIVDGLSTDETMKIIENHRSRFAAVISEKDKGIYDAMNKGLALATGEYVLFLNAGDELYNSNTLRDVFNSAEGADVYYGETAVVDNEGKVLGNRRLAPPEKLTWRSLRFGMCVSHQSFIARKSFCGNYDPLYKISADIDWTIRVLKESKTVVNSHLYISRFLEGGTSAQRRKQGLKERWQIMVKHYGWLATIINHGWILLRFIGHRISRKSMT